MGQTRGKDSASNARIHTCHRTHYINGPYGIIHEYFQGAGVSKAIISLSQAAKSGGHESKEASCEQHEQLHTSPSASLHTLLLRALVPCVRNSCGGLWRNCCGSLSLLDLAASISVDLSITCPSLTSQRLNFVLPHFAFGTREELA